MGGRHARFSRFIEGSRDTLTYLGDMVRGGEQRYLGHNPAGAAMIVTRLAALSGTAFTGWLMEEPDRLAMLPEMPQIVAPAWTDNDGDEYDYGERGAADGRTAERGARNLCQPDTVPDRAARGGRRPGLGPASLKPGPRHNHRRQAPPGPEDII